MSKRITVEDVVRILDDLSLLVEMKGENPFKARAYANAARTLETLGEDLEGVIAQGRLSALRGIGPAIAKKIEELAATGTMRYYEDLKASIPPGHFELLKIPGLGPKKIRLLYEKMGIETVGELEYAARENLLLDLPGFGERMRDKILEGIEAVKGYRERRLYPEALAEAEALLGALRAAGLTDRVEMAGSLRRGRETVKDIDLLVATDEPVRPAALFASLPSVRAVTGRGDTKVSVRLQGGINADLRISTPGEFPFMLHHLTGSKGHNTALRGRAKGLGITMNEYGLFAGDRLIPCASEEEIFAALGLRFIPPELREDMGEIEAAAEGRLPDLVTEGDVRGLLHVHTRASDGALEIEALVAEAKRRGYAYLGISDHSRSAAYAGGLDREAIKRQHDLIDAVNAAEGGAFHVFKGIEADILPDGRLDYDDEILAAFDFVIAAVHSHFTMSAEEMTRRVCRALSHPLTTILAHPTGRLLLAREPYAVDIRRVMDEAAARGVVLEINAHPQRLDLDWRHCLYARRRGCLFAVNPDLHTREGFSYLRWGIMTARKGWLEAKDLVNCLGTQELSAFFARRRAAAGL
ncbi:MAG TPA: DNA polymerase/3'-5' exonuclease PolX [Syntrophales bacterium]|nr:DNA polymerase/3'-5' exonuclease PolX [Syntrophales bacterium]HOM06246.1 DNA polymerase/3'-5' exonuclease PolX [Syntrophales bacterium]HPQ05772.1 DNA polymerase/3'-5' exonuclease PolX [Syntrophales bacterium]HRV41912.1 DNA polymerase/3'-5' exonuclease PolX [Syntrophales bacterium]